MAGELKYWEDVVDAPVRRFGPVVFHTALLDSLLDLMGEKHPVHQDDSFAQVTSRRQRIVPGGFIHSITSGWAVQHGAPVAVVGIRSLAWDFIRPLYPDTPFWFMTEHHNAQEINERLGLVTSVRRVVNGDDEVIAIGRMNVVILRRSHNLSNTTTELAA